MGSDPNPTGRSRSHQRAILQHVERELTAYPETKRELARLREDVIYQHFGQDLNAVTTSRASSLVWSDPTANRATVLATHAAITEMARICQAIEDVLGRLPEPQRRLVEMRYWGTWGTSWAAAAAQAGADERTCRRWDRLVLEAIAERLGWG